MKSVVLGCHYGVLGCHFSVLQCRAQGMSNGKVSRRPRNARGSEERPGLGQSWDFIMGMGEMALEW